MGMPRKSAQLVSSESSPHYRGRGISSLPEWKLTRKHVRGSVRFLLQIRVSGAGWVRTCPHDLPHGFHKTATYEWEFDFGAQIRKGPPKNRSVAQCHLGLLINWRAVSPGRDYDVDFWPTVNSPVSQNLDKLSLTATMRLDRRHPDR